MVRSAMRLIVASVLGPPSSAGFQDCFLSLHRYLLAQEPGWILKHSNKVYCYQPSLGSLLSAMAAGSTSYKDSARLPLGEMEKKGSSYGKTEHTQNLVTNTALLLRFKQPMYSIVFRLTEKCDCHSWFPQGN